MQQFRNISEKVTGERDIFPLENQLFVLNWHDKREKLG